MKKQPVKRRIVCTATTLRGYPCRSWAVQGTDPPRCASHGGVSSRPGAPLGNLNALTHGIYAKNWNRHRIFANPALKTLLGVGGSESVTGVMTDAERQQSIALVTRTMLDKFLALSGYIDEQAEKLPLPALAHLLALFAQMASRLGRLLRDQRILDPKQGDGISEALERCSRATAPGLP